MRSGGWGRTNHACGSEKPGDATSGTDDSADPAGIFTASFEPGKPRTQWYGCSRRNRSHAVYACIHTVSSCLGIADGEGSWAAFENDAGSGRDARNPTSASYAGAVAAGCSASDLAERRADD